MESKTADKANIFPAFRYDDAPAAIDWLHKAFGFEKHFIVPGPDNSIAHAQMKLGSGLVMLGSSPSESDASNPWDAVDIGTYVYIEDIESHYQKARAAGAEIVTELRDTEYGSKEYSALDSEGNLWSFGTYQPLDDPS